MAAALFSRSVPRACVNLQTFFQEFIPPHASRIRPFQKGVGRGDDPISGTKMAASFACSHAAPVNQARRWFAQVRCVHDVRNRLSGQVHLHCC